MNDYLIIYTINTGKNIQMYHYNYFHSAPAMTKTELKNLKALLSEYHQGAGIIILRFFKLD